MVVSMVSRTARVAVQAWIGVAAVDEVGGEGFEVFDHVADGAWGRPLHRLRRSPSPALRERIADGVRVGILSRARGRGPRSRWRGRPRPRRPGRRSADRSRASGHRPARGSARPRPAPSPRGTRARATMRSRSSRPVGDWPKTCRPSRICASLRSQRKVSMRFSDFGLVAARGRYRDRAARRGRNRGCACAGRRGGGGPCRRRRSTRRAAPRGP